MFKRLGWLTLLVLVSVTSFAAMNAAAYPNPTSAEVDSTIMANALSPPIVMDKYDAKMANGSCSADRQCTMVLIRNTNQSANVGPEDTIISNLPAADTTEGGRQNVQINRPATCTQGALEVAPYTVLVCDTIAMYGYIGPKFPDKNGQSIGGKHRSPLPEVVYIGDRSGPGDGETYFALTCDSLAFAPDIGDPVQQASRSEYQTLSATPEVVYLGDSLPAGDSNFSPNQIG